jgi:hypothetical protein
MSLVSIVYSSIAAAFPGFKLESAREGNLISAQIRVNLLCDRNKISCRVGHRADFSPAATVNCPTLIKLIQALMGGNPLELRLRIKVSDLLPGDVPR